MESADNTVTGIAPGSNLVVDAENDAAGALGGAEERRHAQGEKVEVVKGH
jgi:hypothetical protein